MTHEMGVADARKKACVMPRLGRSHLEYSVVKDLRDPFLVWAHYGYNKESVVRGS